MARQDPAPSFKFKVELGGIIEAHFTECSGLSAERTVMQYEEGGVNDYVHVLPGRIKYSNIVLKHGVTDSSALWDWYKQGLREGRVKQVENISILLFDSTGKRVKRWNIKDAYPVKWAGPDFNAGNSQVAIETLEIAHHGFDLA
ncbi:MAG: phage tail protein [Anaerolineae bacterium]|jgi:phage tail-like protein